MFVFELGLEVCVRVKLGLIRIGDLWLMGWVYGYVLFSVYGL